MEAPVAGIDVSKDKLVVYFQGKYYEFQNNKQGQWCFTNFTQNDTIFMEEKNIRAELEKSAYFNTRSKNFHIC
ncbi:Partial transposon ISC1190 [Saccharolobus solfataricus]|uniref:Partial transposon ISC1190 n=1 Tax=Saccharolobus solfataricus TaxID=2287 RepID=A0A157SY31_SACSO|nr:Partial transposon ISC1190 [Saccharolobus solfataricus]